MSDPDIGLAAALRICKTPTELARRLGISAQAVCQWRIVPPMRVIAVENATGVHRTILRPDMYPPELGRIVIEHSREEARP